jgi:hypothetical protein
MKEMERASSTIQFVSTNLTNRLEQIGVSVRVLKRSDGTSRHRRRIPLPRNGTKSVDSLELRQLEMQGQATKVDSIGAKLGSENGVDGVIPFTSIESSSRSKAGLLDSENRATLDRQWSSRLEFAQVSTEAMIASGENKCQVRIFTGGGHG